ncbi:MAG: hypothetical protein U5L75_02420 [Candidatus Campbellbacteria bacterium]|nr:hypothetical protein [Candidatus Campbellbacteria bacterium]
MNKKGLFLILLVALVGVFVWVNYFASEDQGNGSGDEGVTITDPQTFESSDYGFSFDRPYDWQFESSSEITPMFSAYVKPAGVPVTPPFDHFANVTHVSVYPEGIPTEGLIGETEPIDFDPGFELTQESQMYVLEDGTPFAAYLVPENKPESWGESGYIWMRVRVEDLTTECFGGEELIPEEECDPMTEDHIIVREGEINESLWSLEKEMVRTFSLGYLIN